MPIGLYRNYEELKLTSHKVMGGSGSGLYRNYEELKLHGQKLTTPPVRSLYRNYEELKQVVSYLLYVATVMVCIVTMRN